jgi:hypothetical protein
MTGKLGYLLFWFGVSPFGIRGKGLSVVVVVVVVVVEKETKTGGVGLTVTGTGTGVVRGGSVFLRANWNWLVTGTS